MQKSGKVVSHVIIILLLSNIKLWGQVLPDPVLEPGIVVIEKNVVINQIVTYQKTITIEDDLLDWVYPKGAAELVEGTTEGTSIKLKWKQGGTHTISLQEYTMIGEVKIHGLVKYTKDVTVTEQAGPDRTYCKSDGVIHLSTWEADLAEGTWSGPGITNNTVDLSVLAAGTHTFTYTRTSDGAYDDMVLTVIETIPGNVKTEAISGCETASGDLTVEGSNVLVKFWERTDDNGSNWYKVSGSDDLQSLPISLTSKAGFRAAMQGTACPIVFTNPVTVEPLKPASGTLSVSNENIQCGRSTGRLELQNASINSSYVWEQSADGTTWSVIQGESDLDHNFDVSQNAHFRVIVSRSNCPSVTSNTYTTYNTTQPGTVSVNNSEQCNTASGFLTLEDNIGTVVSWEESIDGNNWSAIQNSGGITQLPFETTESKKYRATVQLNNCTLKYSNQVNVTISSPTNPGVVRLEGTPTFDLTSDNKLRFHATFSLNDYLGDIQFWQKESLTQNSNIDNQTPLVTVEITETTTMRASVKNGVCDPLLSGSAKFVVNEPFKGVLDVNQYLQIGRYVGSSYNIQSPDGVSLGDGFSFIANSAQDFFVLLDDNYTLPPQDQNYVLEEVVLQDGITDEDNIYFANAYQRQSSYNYSDGLGRPLQKVQRRSSPSEKDIVKPITYDVFGRPDKDYLPYVSQIDDGNYREAFLDEQLAFYRFESQKSKDKMAFTDFPFSETVFESSPLNRVFEKGAPGTEWQPRIGHAVKFTYEVNVGADEVIIWEIDPDTKMPLQKGYYDDGSLFITVMTDEHLVKAREFKDKHGLVVLKQVRHNDQWVGTYHIYDDFDLLRYVIQPEGVAQIAGDPDQEFLNKWAFQFKYDERRRMIEHQRPGAGPTLMVYDRLDRQVLTQDANQRALNQWMFVKYDAFNRPVVTGIATISDSEDASKILTRDEVNGKISVTEFTENYSSTGSLYGYTNNVFPTENLEVHTVNYYDNYDFINDVLENGFAYDKDALSGMEQQPFNSTMGLATGAFIRILDSDKFLSTVTWYDKRSRPVQILSDNHVDGTDKISMRYDFTGKLLEKNVQHKKGQETISITEEFNYDHAGRTLSHYHKIGNGKKTLLKSFAYNKVGQVVEKNLHAKEEGDYFQSIDYRYNVRGWLTHINNAALTSDDEITNDDANDFFGMQLNYTNTSFGGSQSMYNGNISEALWKSFGSQEQGYSYNYDALNRLTAANYYDLEDPLNNSKFNEHISAYDLNGNIRKLDRSGTTGSLMDELGYTYIGNQLQKVDDYKDKTKGFVDGSNTDNDYDYDDNGNMTKDKNKSIDVISYNYLNLPEKVTKTTGEYITYTYDASGRKLAQSVYNASDVLQKRTDYLGEFFYEDDVLKFINHEEGRIIMEGSTPEYQYHLKDHLGNVRLTFTTKEETAEFKATMESNHVTKERADFPNYDNVTIFDDVDTHNHTDEPGAIATVVLNGAPDKQVGLAKSIKVVPGDVIDMEVFAKYFIPGSSGGSVGTAIASAMTGAFQLSASSDGLEYSAFQAINTIFNTGWVLESEDWEDINAPKAFLNYILFDEDYIPYDMGWDQIDYNARVTDTNPNPDHDRMTLQAYARKPGYIYIYFSNEDDEIIEVFFDDFMVEHIKSPVIAMQDYYAFGLTFNSYRRENSTKNQYLYNNGAERQDELDLNVDATKFRMYDPAMCRWWQIDPLADGGDLVAWTPYNYSFNNPIRYNDPNGDCPPGMDCEAMAGGMWNAVKGVGSFIADTWNSGGQNLVQAAQNVNALGTLAVNAPEFAGEVVTNAAKEGFVNSIQENGGVQGAVSSMIGEATVGFLLGAATDKGLSKIGTIVNKTEDVVRVMSKAELNATQSTGLVRGGRQGTHYVTNAASNDAKRATQRLALPTKPEVKATLQVPKGSFSKPTKVQPANGMPGGGLERTGTGKIPAKVKKIEEMKGTSN